MLRLSSNGTKLSCTTPISALQPANLLVTNGIDAHDHRNYGAAESYWHQALSALDKKQTSNADDEKSYAFVAEMLGSMLVEQGRYQDAEPLLNKVLAIREKVSGERDSYTISAKHNLAVLYFCERRYKDAESLFLECISRRSKAVHTAQNDIACARAMTNLAHLYVQTRRYSEAESLCKQALQLKRKTLADNNPSVTTTLAELAEAQRQQSMSRAQ